MYVECVRAPTFTDVYAAFLCLHHQVHVDEPAGDNLVFLASLEESDSLA
jgi:hypothetical protein